MQNHLEINNDLQQKKPKTKQERVDVRVCACVQ